MPTGRGSFRRSVDSGSSFSLPSGAHWPRKHRRYPPFRSRVILGGKIASCRAFASFNRLVLEFSGGAWFLCGRGLQPSFRYGAYQRWSLRPQPVYSAVVLPPMGFGSWAAMVNFLVRSTKRLFCPVVLRRPCARGGFVAAKPGASIGRSLSARSRNECEESCSKPVIWPTENRGVSPAAILPIRLSRAAGGAREFRRFDRDRKKNGAS